MIIIRLSGGLGNQMFQYALGRRLALERRVPLALDIEGFATDALRTYRLNHFRISATIATRADYRRVVPWPAFLRGRFERLWPISRRRILQERQFSFMPSILACGRSAYLAGYWQTERYFDTIPEVIRSDFRLLEPMAASRQALAARMRDGVSVSVHVRRGDYVADPVVRTVHGTCSPEWYERTMEKMAASLTMGQGRTPTFFVFSDDPDWARENLPSRWPTHFVPPDSDGREFEDLHLMAQCHHHITANSSFSWWGAWLNPDPRKQVMVPARWFADAPRDTRDMIPASWMRVE
ncbi:MAG: alpha-1,2-fucosyltransferase [Alphaproteobacteria bacterium]